MQTIMLHVVNEDPVVGEVEALPQTNDTMVKLTNPRRKDGKDIHYLEANVTTAIWPLHRIALIEIMATAEEEEIIGFVRER